MVAFSIVTVPTNDRHKNCTKDTVFRDHPMKTSAQFLCLLLTIHNTAAIRVAHHRRALLQTNRLPSDEIPPHRPSLYNLTAPLTTPEHHAESVLKLMLCLSALMTVHTIITLLRNK